MQNALSQGQDFRKITYEKLAYEFHTIKWKQIADIQMYFIEILQILPTFCEKLSWKCS